MNVERAESPIPMQTHLTDDELVLHYYGEMAEADEHRAVGHLSGCAACHASYRHLQRVLAAVDEAALAGPEMPEGFERQVWARLEPQLPRQGNGWLSWVLLSPPRLAWAAGVVVLVAAAFVAGRWSPRLEEAPSHAAINPAAMRERVLLMDLGEHLDRSQMVLVELLTAGADAGLDVSMERTRAEQLVAANRLYRHTAASTGEAGVVDFLEELERVLIDVAAGPDQLSADQLAEMRRRIDAHGLLFKVRVLSSEVRERQKSAYQKQAAERTTL